MDLLDYFLSIKATNASVALSEAPFDDPALVAFQSSMLVWLH